MPSNVPKALLPRLVLTLCLVCALPARAAAWDSSGHRIIAQVAAANLSPAARAEVNKLLGKEDLVGVSTYADEVRVYRPETSAWHFVEMPLNAKAYVPSRDCVYTSRGDCAVAAVQRLTKILRSPTVTGAQAGGEDFGKVIDASQRGLSPGGELTKAEALKFLVHLVGDLHQPLHCGYKDDAGGTRIRVSFGGRNTNLHALWDTHLVAFAQQSAAPKGLGEIEYATERLLPKLGDIPQAMRNGDTEKAWTRLKEINPARTKYGTPEDWTFESYELARRIVNVTCQWGQQAAAPPKGKPRRRGRSPRAAVMQTTAQGVAGTPCVADSAARPIRLGDNYYRGGYEKELDEQLLWAGVRLALLLNDIFR